MLTTPAARRFERLTRRLEELRAWRNAREYPFEELTFIAGDGAPVPIQVGAFWPVVETPVRFRGTGRVPEAWAGQPVELELWLGGDGLVRLSTGLQTGLDPFHHRFPIAEAALGGETIELDAEVVPKGMFGSHIAEPRIERTHLVVPERAARALERDVAMLLEACEHLGDQEVVPTLLNLVDAAFARLGLDWPTATDTVVSRLVLGYVNPIGSGMNSVWSGYSAEAADVHPYSAPIWHMPPAPLPLEPLPATTVQAIEEARAFLADGLTRITASYPPVGRLALTGHAHIDLAWLWPLAETRRKARRTFSSVLELMERYDDFTFNQSSAQAYAWIEEDDPALFARIRQRVAEGRWEPIGGSWVEPDCNVTGGEAFVRQLLYGQRYFEDRFGRRSTVAWLPDVFGFSGGVPQLLRGAGITGFFTIKPTWNEANLFPYDLFAWEGIDGSTVTAHMFRNVPPAHGYNGNVAPLDVIGTWQRFGGKRLHPESLFAFGWGDGGGGPSEKMLDNYARLKEFPAMPRLRMTMVEEFYADLPTAGLPRWVGEIYFELHRATLTTQGKTKALNRAAEHRLLEAEAFGALAAADGFAYPKDALEAAWKTLLLHQFHDDLPGSSIAEVYQDMHRDLGAVVAMATEARDAALAHVGGGTPTGSGAWLVGNAALMSRPLCVLLPNRDGSDRIADATGQPLPSQATDDGLLVYDRGKLVPGLGWLTLAATADAPAVPDAPSVRADVLNGGAMIENELARVEIGADGGVARLYDKTADREVFDGRGNQLWAFVDKPRAWDAWDIDESYEQAGEELRQVDRIEVTEAGPLRASVRVARTWRDSRIVQTYRLLAGSRRLDIATEIDWHERTILLQARFPLAVRTHEATYETMYGAVRRPTHRNTSWDLARFEVCGQRFADLSEPGYGVALLNDAKYGHGARGNLLSLSLVRGPLYPDPRADEGEHRFTYSLLPHAGDWTGGDVVTEAFALNSPLVAVPIAADGGSTVSGAGFVEVEGVALALGSLKPAEDGNGLMLRLYEPHGARGIATLRFRETPRAVELVNLLEDAVAAGERIVHDGATVRLAVRPFEVVSLRVVR